MCRLVLDEWKPAIATNRKNVWLKKGEQLIREGEPVTGVYFVYSGKVKVHKRWGDRELIVRFASQGAIIGHRGIGTNNTTYPVSATALEPTLVCFVEIEFFLSTLKVNHGLTYQLMLFYADELLESEKKMRNLALMPVKGRLARAILQLQEQFGLTPEGAINIELSRQDIAAFAGATYETVFRTLNELVQENLVAVSGKSIRIIDHEKLSGLTREAG